MCACSMRLILLTNSSTRHQQCDPLSFWLESLDQVLSPESPNAVNPALQTVLSVSLLVIVMVKSSA